MKRFAKQKGFTLIEILLVIGFIAGALVLAFITYPKVQAQGRANTEGQHLITVSGGIKNLYSTAQNYGSLSNAVLIGSKVIPDDMQVSGSTINNVWGGTFSVSPDGAASNLRYTMIETNVPVSECVKMGTGVATSFLKADINGTIVIDKTVAAQVNPDPGAITAACSSATNTMTFTGN